MKIFLICASLKVYHWNSVCSCNDISKWLLFSQHHFFSLKKVFYRMSNTAVKIFSFLDLGRVSGFGNMN